MRECYAEIADSGLGSVAALCSAATPAATIHARHSHRQYGIEPCIFASPPRNSCRIFPLATDFSCVPPIRQSATPLRSRGKHTVDTTDSHVPAAVALGKLMKYHQNVTRKGEAGLQTSFHWRNFCAVSYRDSCFFFRLHNRLPLSIGVSHI